MVIAAYSPTWPDDARRDRLVGDWYLYQRTGGHRTSTDDVITAWFATHRTKKVPARNPPENYLDLGCGIGSVLLMVARALRPKHSLGIEAQEQSYEMATRSVSELPSPSPPIEVLCGDLRDASFDKQFDVITGSPPYFPLQDGTPPKDKQRRACRFEVRGGVEAYCQAASRWLMPTGRFYLVFQKTWQTRVEKASFSNGLHISAQIDFWAKLGQPSPFLTVFEMQRQACDRESLTMAVRDDAGNITSDYLSLRSELGLG